MRRSKDQANIAISEFDERGFVSGVQLMADSFADVMLPGGSGQVDGIGSVV